MNDTTPTPPMPSFPPPVPKKSRTNRVIIGSAAAVVAAVIGTGIVVVNSREDGAHENTSVGSTATPSADSVTAAEEEPDSQPTDTGPQVFGLDDVVTYENHVEVSLSKFARGTSSSYASPERTPYVKFVVKVKNDSGKPLDTTLFSVSCSYGQDGKSAEPIFDDGLDGGPETKLLSGRSINVPWACEFPKGEATLQVEVDANGESETAIFTGDVK
ncbi:hypothetical protein [Streptomyces sp. NRRL B-3648]|uniref:hypothetical protein n=1 Tax=Streptomyces sp. NRRL B-3648 TaxID=1519493 RepID=UPI0006B04CEF|nr:hypothetical protein [Streptomyces sp. NRRL B-3648]KOV92971.1 hypothetical protein ADL04_28630 [Streptomyces sp. NRRL B-3648]